MHNLVTLELIVTILWICRSNLGEYIDHTHSVYIRRELSCQTGGQKIDTGWHGRIAYYFSFLIFALIFTIYTLTQKVTFKTVLYKNVMSSVSIDKMMSHNITLINFRIGFNAFIVNISTHELVFLLLKYSATLE